MSVDETRVLKHELVGIVGSLIQPGAYTKVVNLYFYIYIYTCICVYLYICIYVYVHVNMCVCVCVCVCVCARARVCLCVQDTWREHRTVVLPDLQGLGVGPRMSDAVASLFFQQVQKKIKK